MIKIATLPPSFVVLERELDEAHGPSYRQYIEGLIRAENERFEARSIAIVGETEPSRGTFSNTFSGSAPPAPAPTIEALQEAYEKMRALPPMPNRIRARPDCLERVREFIRLAETRTERMFSIPVEQDDELTKPYEVDYE